jgi:hypothetical protein
VVTEAKPKMTNRNLRVGIDVGGYSSLYILTITTTQYVLTKQLEQTQMESSLTQHAPRSQIEESSPGIKLPPQAIRP